jgi:hypothetical protein
MRNESAGREKKDNVPLDLLLDRPVTLQRKFRNRNVIVLPELLQPVSSYLGTWFGSLIKNVPLEGVGLITERALIPSPFCKAISEVDVIVAEE